MGISTSKQKTKSSETLAPTTFSQPYIESAAATLKPGYDESLAASREYQPGLLAASKYYGDALGGKFLESGPAFEESPYLEGVIGSTNADITDAVNAQFMPRFGSGYHAKTLARAIGENENNLRYGDAVRRDSLKQDAYARERGYQDSAGGKMAGIATTATTLPMIPAQGYSDAVSSLLGRYLKSDGTSETKSKRSLLDYIASAAQSAAMAFGGG